MTTLETKIIQALQEWLGCDAIDVSRAATYCWLVMEIARIESDIPDVAVEAVIDDVKAVADGFARARLEDRSSSYLDVETLPVVRRSRSRSNGLRRGVMDTRVTAAVRRHVAPVPESSRSVFKSGYLAYLPYSDRNDGAVEKSDFVTYLHLCRRIAPVDVHKTADIVIRELSQVANEPSYWLPGRPASCTDWNRRAGERIDGLSVVESIVPTPIAFVAGSRYLTLVTRLIRQATRSIDLLVPRLWPGTSRSIREALDALSDASERGLRVRVLFADPGPDAGKGIQSVARFARAYLRDATGHTLHESTVVIDARHIITGSQSWTPSAVHRAIELSTYMDAPVHAELLVARFESFWQFGSPGKAVG